MSGQGPNGILRFILELVGMAVFAVWGYAQGDSPLNIVYAICLPLGFAALWGVFATRNDPSRSGKTVIQTPGIVRLLLELALFGAAVWMLLNLDYTTIALILGIVVTLHYLISYERIGWLLNQK